jgi:hypothetical protein
MSGWIWALAWLLALLPMAVTASAASQDELPSEQVLRSLVLVNAYRDQQLTASGIAVVVQVDRFNSYLLTSAALVRDENRLAITVGGDARTLPAQVFIADPATNVAVLTVNGLHRPAAVFSLVAGVIGDSLWSAAAQAGGASIGFTPGLIRQAYYLENKIIGVVSHSAAVAGDSLGSVIVNPCGQLLGLNMGVVGPDGNLLALNANSLKAILNRQSLGMTEAQGNCPQSVPSAAVPSAALAESAPVVRDKAELAMLTAQRAEATVVQTRDEMARKTDQIIADTQALAKQIEASSGKAEAQILLAQQRQVESSQYRDRIQLITFVLLGIACLALLVMALLVYKSARKNPSLTISGPQLPVAPSDPDMAAANPQKSATAAEYVLDGCDDAGIRYLLRMPGSQLLAANGVVIGRNPKDSPYIINHADVSRKHARLRMMQDRVFIEDLGSTNGTSVNGQAIDEKGPISVISGDQIIIGSVVMKLKVTGA